MFMTKFFRGILPFFVVLLSFLSFSATAQQKVLNTTVLLMQKKAPDNQALAKALKSQWKVPMDSLTITDKTLVFNTIGGSTVMIAYLDYPAATDETGAAARLSWIWKNGTDVALRHQATMVVSVIGPSAKTLELYKILTQTTAAVCEATQAAAVFQQSQYLLLSSDYFISAARNMVANQTLPLYCWVYFGRPGDGNGFTLGMVEFGLPEMEIAASEHPEAEVHATLYDAALTVLKYHSKLADGSTLTTEEGTALPVKIGKSAFLEEQTVIKLSY